MKSGLKKIMTTTERGVKQFLYSIKLQGEFAYTLVTVSGESVFYDTLGKWGIHPDLKKTLHRRVMQELKTFTF